MKKLVFMIISALICGMVFTSCSKMDNVDDTNYCSYVSVKNIDKSIPIVTKILDGLPNGLDDEEKLQELATWLKSCPCIIDATVAYKSNFAPNGKWESEIVISYDENGTTKYFMLEILMTKPLAITGYYGPDKPRDLFVKTKYYYTIDKVLNFINSLKLDIIQIEYSGAYFSSMPHDNLQSIVDALNDKPYFNAGDYGYNWRIVYGAVHFYFNKITIVRPTFYNMKNIEYQKDWLKTMINYRLAEAIEDEDAYKEDHGYWILFRVPKGTEKQWETKFKKYEFVEQVNLVSYPYPPVWGPHL